MKIISLNIWGGRAGHEELLAFFKRNGDVDVFCLQEVWRAPYETFEGHPAGGLRIDHLKVMSDALFQICKALPDHNYYFCPQFLDDYGIAIFIKKNIIVQGGGDVHVHKHKGFMPEGDIGRHARSLQYLHLSPKEHPLTIMNLHGLWNGKGKGDSDDRIEQSKRIIEFAASLGRPFVLCGDLNLLLETESIKMLERAGMRNLIREYGITSTRSPLYTKPEKHADYIMVSEGVDVERFSVLPDVVSDHLALEVTVR